MLSNNEMQWVVKFLDELCDRFANDGCNDLYMENTPENVELLIQATRHEWREEPSEIDYLIERIKKQAATGKPLLADNSAICHYLKHIASENKSE